MKIKLREWLRTTKAQDILIISIILLVSISLRFGIAYNTRGLPIYSDMAACFGVTAMNLVEGNGYSSVDDPEWVNLITNTQAEKNMLIDLEDFPPPKSNTFIPYSALPPGTSLMLAGGYLISGEYRYIYGRLLEAIIGSFGCLIMFLLGKELFNRKIGLIAAVIYALYLPLAYITTWPLGDALIPFFTLLAAYLFVIGVRRNSLKYFIFSAVVSGIATYFQVSTIFPLMFFFGGYFIYNLGKLRFWKNLLQVIKIAVISIVVFFLVLTPWIIRNYHVSGEVILLLRSVTGWQGVWEGFGEYPNPVGAVLDDDVTLQQIKDEYGSDVEYLSPEFSAALKAKTFKAIKEHPGWFFSLLARRLPLTFFYQSDLGIMKTPRDTNGDVQPYTDLDSLTRVEVALKSGKFSEAWNIAMAHPYSCFVSGLTFLFQIIPPLVSLFAIWLMRRRWRTTALVFMAPLSYTVLHMITFINFKTLLPGAFFFILLSAVALYYIAIKLKIIHDDRMVFYPTQGEG